MEITKPTEGEIAVLLAEHAHRHPEKARFKVTDGENQVALPILLGNPSGACKMPEGKPASGAWDATVAATFKMRADSDSMTEQLASDCVLWPDVGTWTAWTRRWAALPEVVEIAIRKKTGAKLSMIDDPGKDDKRPDAVATALDRYPGAVWRRLKPLGAEFDVAIAPPEAAVWRLFLDAMKKRDAKHAELARDLALSCMKVLLRTDGTPVAAADHLDRYCGQTLLIGAAAAHLAGITADVELGEW